MSSLNLWYFITGNLNVTTLNYVFLICFLFFFTKNAKLLVVPIFFFFKASCFIFTVNKIPLELIIGYNSWHPPLFYVSVILTVFLFWQTEQSVKLFIKWILSVAVITLILGGYWGLGNSVWGYFWVNDVIELMLLFYILAILLYIHFVCNKYNKVNVLTILLCGFIFLFLLRHGLVFTRHSFFNTKNLTNTLIICVVFFIYNGLSHIILPILLILLYPGLYLVLLQLIGKGWHYLGHRVILLVTHSLIFILALSWVKFKTLALTYFSTGIVGLYTINKISVKIIDVGNLLFFLKKSKKVKLLVSIFFTYLVKVLAKPWLVATSYVFTVWYVFCFCVIFVYL